jgi:hypothetical protein
MTGGAVRVEQVLESTRRQLAVASSVLFLASITCQACRPGAAGHPQGAS